MNWPVGYLVPSHVTLARVTPVRVTPILDETNGVNVERCVDDTETETKTVKEKCTSQHFKLSVVYFTTRSSPAASSGKSGVCATIVFV